VVSSTPRSQFTPGKDPVPIVQEAGWAPGPVWTGGKSRPHRDSIPDRPVRSQSLYRLTYPAHDASVMNHFEHSCSSGNLIIKLFTQTYFPYHNFNILIIILILIMNSHLRLYFMSVLPYCVTSPQALLPEHLNMHRNTHKQIAAKLCRNILNMLNPSCRPNL